MPTLYDSFKLKATLKHETIRVSLYFSVTTPISTICMLFNPLTCLTVAQLIGRHRRQLKKFGQLKLCAPHLNCFTGVK